MRVNIIQSTQNVVWQTWQAIYKIFLVVWFWMPPSLVSHWVNCGCFMLLGWPHYLTIVPVLLLNYRHFWDTPWGKLTYQWKFQDPKMEVLTIYKAYVRAYVRGHTPKIWPLNFPLNIDSGLSKNAVSLKTASFIKFLWPTPHLGYQFISANAGG